MEENLVEHGAQHVSVAFVGHCHFHCFGDGTAQASAVVRVFRQDLSAGFGPVGWRCKDLCAEGFHDILSKRFLVVGNLYHINLQVEAEIGACFGQRCSPLACAGFGSYALEAFLLGVVRLRYCGVELVASGRVVSFEFIVDLRRCVQRFFQVVGSAKRRRAVDLIDVAYFFRDVEISRFVVHFLLSQFFAEYRIEVFHCRRFAGRRVDHRRRLFFHVSAQVIPLLRDLIFC